MMKALLNQLHKIDTQCNSKYLIKTGQLQKKTIITLKEKDNFKGKVKI